jgi:phosphoglycerate dehydrogenase-like enzyme
VVNEGALIDVLRQKRIAGAALDVFRPEPLAADHPFWTLPNIIITPHLGGVFDEYSKRALPIFEENVRRYLAGDFDHMINRVQH